MNELSERMKEGSVFLLDVRHGDEFEAGHLPGALNRTPLLKRFPWPGAWHYAPVVEDTRIDLPGDQRHCNISQSMSISRSQFQDRY
ncbi:rhodanese-like domain-containing protein [Pseudomonas cedrina]|uniref:rhodanese-like domain-containing protein n=1 Tax=Pseudomonas cedrina TaxID=651740 RepID=UPI003ED90C90